MAGKVVPFDGRNGPSDEDIQKAVKDYEKIEQQLLEMKMDYLRDCKPHRQDQAAIVDHVVKQGANRKAFHAKLKERSFYRKAREVVARLESEDRMALDALSKSLGELGKAALEAHDDKVARDMTERAMGLEALANMRTPTPGASSAPQPPSVG